MICHISAHKAGDSYLGCFQFQLAFVCMSSLLRSSAMTMKRLCLGVNPDSIICDLDRFPACFLALFNVAEKKAHGGDKSYIWNGQ